MVARLGWLPREQFVHDWGIDVHVERTEGSRPTGELIAVQVKGGPSFFRPRGPGGWWFSFDEPHASYWLQHALPVIVVLVDIETEKAYWQEISLRTVDRTTKRWRVLVPRAQPVDQALPDWGAMLERRVREHAVLFNAALDRLPPSCATHLEALQELDSIRAGHLAQRLTGPNPSAAVDQVLASSEWLAAAGRHGPLAVANFCAEHGLHAAQARALEIAANVDESRAARHLAVAAMADPDRDRAAKLLADARARDSKEAAVAIAATVVGWTGGGSGSDEDDPVLDQLGSDKADVLVHALRATRALRKHDWAAAIPPLQSALEIEPASSGHMIELAVALANRSRTPAGSVTDLSAAEHYAREAIHQRRKWGGSTRDPLEILVRVLGMQTRLDEALRACLPAPEGEATAAEVADPFIAHLAAFTAKRLDRSEQAVRAILGRIQPAAARQDALDEFASEAAGDEERRAVLRRAIERPDAAAFAGLFVQRVFELALLGDDASAEFDRLRNASVPADYKALIGVVARHAREPAVIDQELRRLSARDPLAAHILIDAMAENGDRAGAAALARRSFERLHDVSFLDLEVRFAFAAADMSNVRRLLEEGLASGLLSGLQLLQYRVQLGEVLAAGNDYRGALRQFEAVLEYPEESWPDSALWNALVCAGKLEDWPRARTVIDRFPKVPVSVGEATVWVNVHVLTGWSAETAISAIELAKRLEGEEPELAQHIAQTLIGQTRGEDPATDEVSIDTEDDDDEVDTPDLRVQVPGQVHADAFAILARAASRSGSGIELLTTVDLQASPLAERLRTASTSDHADAVRRLGDQVAGGVLPLGMLATTLREPYGLTLARRILGVRFGSAADGEVHASEVEAAATARGGGVVIDSSVLDLLPDLDAATDALNEFARVAQPVSAKRDLAVSAVAARADTASVGRLSWDAMGERPILRPSDPAQQIAVLERANRMLRIAESVEVAPVDVADRIVNLDLNDDAAPWLDPIDLAHQLGLPLWSDDAAQRRLASAFGVATFGTVNLQEAARLQPLKSPDVTADEVARIAREQEDAVVKLARSGVAEQPVTIDVMIEDIVLNRGEPSLVSSALARPAWWAGNHALGDWFSIMERVIQLGGSVDTFQEMAMMGAARRFHAAPAIAARVLALMAARGRAPLLTAIDIEIGFRVARRCAELRDVEDPVEHLEWAVRVMAHTTGAETDLDDLIIAATARLESANT